MNSPHTLRRSVGVSLVSGAMAVATLAASCTGTSGSQVEVRSREKPAGVTSTTRPPDCAEVLSPRAQAGQLLMVMVTTPALAKQSLDDADIGGFGLKGRQSADVADEIASTISDAPLPPFVASDEEGGSVQRLADALGDLPSAATMAKGTPEEAGATMKAYGTKMRAAGVNMIFGPVADVGSGSDLGSRSFGEDPHKVADFVSAIVTGQQQSGLISVVKHWPGIGAGGSDPHETLDELDPIEELRARDLIPFQAALSAGVPAVMVAHARIPGLTEDDLPASLSSAAITGELRGREKFAGLVITDSLGMGAVVNSVTQAEAAEMAITAGADIALLSGVDAVQAAHDRLTEAIAQGRVPQSRARDAVRRVLSAKGISGECPDLAAKLALADQDKDRSATTGDSTPDVPNGGGTRDTGINDANGGGNDPEGN